MKGDEMMSTQDNKLYYDANDLADMLGVSVGYSYKLIRKLNKELSDQGYIVIAGKVSSEYFKKKWYGFEA